MAAKQSENFPTFSLENHLTLRPRQYLSQVLQIAYAKRLNEQELITAALNHCVGHAKTLIDNEPIFSGQMSWGDFCHKFTTFFSKHLTFNELLEIFESMNQKSGEDVETFGKRLESMANTLTEMAQNTLLPEASIRAIEKDLVRIFVNGLIVGKDEVMKENPKNLQEAVKIAKIVQMQRYSKSSAAANPNIGSISVNNKFAAEELNIIEYDLNMMKLMLNSSVTTGEMVGGFLNQIKEHLNKLSAIHDYISDGQLKNWHSDVKHKAKNLKKHLKSYSISTQTKQLSLDEIWAEINKLDLELHQKPRSTFKDPDVHRKVSDKLQHISSNLSTVTPQNTEENKIYNEASSRMKYLKIHLLNLESDPPKNKLTSKEEQRLNEISRDLDRMHTKIQAASDTSLKSNNELNNEVQNIMIELKNMKISEQSSVKNLHSQVLCRGNKIDEFLKEIQRRHAPSKSPPLLLDVLGELRTKIEKLETFLKRTTLNVKSFEDYSHRVYQISQQLGGFSNFPDEESERLHSNLKSRTEVLTRLQITPPTGTGNAEKLLLEASAAMENLRKDTPSKSSSSLGDFLREIGTKIGELELIVQMNADQSVMDKASSDEYKDRVDQISQQLAGFIDFPDEETKRLHSNLQLRTKVLTQLQISPKPDTGDAKKFLLEASTAKENLIKDAPSKKPSLGDVLGEIDTKVEEIELIVLMNSNTTAMDKTSCEDYRDRVDQISQQLGSFSDFPNKESQRLHSKLHLRVKVLTELLLLKFDKSLKPEISDSEKNLLEASTAMESLKIKITEFTKKGVKSERQFTCLDDELTKILTVLYAFDISERSSMRMKRKELIVVAQKLTQDLEKSFKGK